MSNLKEHFSKRVSNLIDIMYKKHDTIFVPFQTTVSLEEQSRLWNQSRTSLEKDQAVSYLQEAGAHKIAALLAKGENLQGRWATNALPGGNWQNFGLGCLLVTVYDGKAVWKRANPIYEKLAIEAGELGLYSGYYFSFPDPQLIVAQRRSPIKEYGWKRIEQILIP